MEGEQTLPKAGRGLVAEPVRNKKLTFYRRQMRKRGTDWFFQISASAEIADRAPKEWINV